MRQICVTKAGPPQVLEVAGRARSRAQGGEVRIWVEATGVNFADALPGLGIYRTCRRCRWCPGHQVGGRIDVVGAGVEGSWAGRQHLGRHAIGGHADTVCVPMNQVFARPTNMSALEAAAIPVNYFTAWQLVVVMGSLKAWRDGPDPFCRRRRRHCRDPACKGYRRERYRHRFGRQARRIARAPLGSITSSTIGPRISKCARARSPTAAASSSFSTPCSVANPGRRAIACWRRPAASACSVCRQQRPARTATCCRCCRRSR